MSAAPSLRRGLLWRLALLMAILSVLTSVVVYQLALRFSDDAYDEWLLDSAHSLAQLVRHRDGRLVADLPAFTLQALTYDAHDRVLFRIDAQREGLLGGQAQAPRSPTSSGERVFFEAEVGGERMRAVQVSRRDLDPRNPVFVTVAETVNKRHRLASRLWPAVLLLSAALGLLTVAMAHQAVNRGLRPLRELTDTVRRRAPGHLHPLPDVGVAIELEAFTGAINALLVKLNQALQHQRRFVADAAHQLRTPLAALRLEIEHALREPDAQLQKEALGQLRAGIERMSRLATQLLTLSRAEPGALAASTFKPIELDKLVHEAAQRSVGVAISRDVDFGYECLSKPTVLGDALLLEELVHNLVDNALRYAGPGAVVTVSVRAQGGWAQLRVEDDGPGVAAADIPRLTERFHRPAGAPAGGSGLGLAIVQEIVAAHSGELHIEPATPVGLCVTVSLPLQAVRPGEPITAALE